jgi:hypothetical protein
MKKLPACAGTGREKSVRFASFAPVPTLSRAAACSALSVAVPSYSLR